MTGPLIKQRTAYQRAMSAVITAQKETDGFTVGPIWGDGDPPMMTSNAIVEKIITALKKEFQQ